MVGRVVDPETALIYLRARYYDPATAQFLTRDPLDTLTRSAYDYVKDNPLNGSDPSGLFWGQSFLKKHWRGIAQGLAIAAVVIAVAAIPVAGLAAASLLVGGSAADAAATFAVAAGLGFAANALDSAQTATVCNYGSAAACHWSESTTGAGWASTAIGHFFPFVGSVIGAGAAIAGLFNPHFGDCLNSNSTPAGPSIYRNPDGSFVSGGGTPYIDPAGVPLDARYQ